MCNDHEHDEAELVSHGGGRVERFLEPCLLLLLIEKPGHGYDMLDRLGRFGFESENQDPGSIYRTLRRLEEDGMVESEWDTDGAGPAKRLYRATREGKDLLEAWSIVIRGTVERLRGFLSEYEALKK
ncbi:MAG: helix-turn-helix transcriptional regulator [Limnochordia bacterium]